MSIIINVSTWLKKQTNQSTKCMPDLKYFLEEHQSLTRLNMFDAFVALNCILPTFELILDSLDLHYTNVFKF